jgi:glyoxylase-like metal-dependent hydrolase (beta-lactamase superfamily II)
VQEIAILDAMMAGVPGITSVYLVPGPSPAVVDTGPRTSAPAVMAALAAHGLGPEDLAWIVLTHVHLDHCGASGLLVRAFPRARVVVHPRGARHLVSPERLVASAAAVYGERASIYGGLDPVPEERVVSAPDGHRIPVGPGRDLVAVEAPGHARHHMALLDEATGTLMAGDALGVRVAGSPPLFPAVPPPDFDLDVALATLGRLAAIGPDRVGLGHFGLVPRPGAAVIAEAAEQQRAIAETALRAWRAGGAREPVAAAVDAVTPLSDDVLGAAAVQAYRRFGWPDANVDGLLDWARRADGAGRG